MGKVSCHSSGGTLEFVLGTICKPLKLEKRFLYENGPEFCMQRDKIKNNYEEGNQKVPFSY